MRDDIDPSTGDLYDWSDEWNQPDLKITSLRRQIKDLVTTVDTQNQTISTIQSTLTLTATLTNRVSEQNKELKLQIRLLTLQILGKIDSEQFKSLNAMLDSVDEENHTVALETINNLENDN